MEEIEVGWVDIIIPFYNGAKYIEETLDSIEKQTFDKIKVICVNNNSTDKSVEIVQRFSEKSRFNFIITSESKPNASAARNKGFEVSKSEFVSFLDSDDLITEDKIERQINYLVDNPHNCAVISDRTVYNEDFSVIKKDLNFSFLFPFKIEDFITQIFITGNPLYRRTSLLKYATYNDTLKVGQDWEFHLRLAINGCSFGYLNGSFLKCRSHATSLSSNWKKVSLIQEAVLFDIFTMKEILSFSNSTRRAVFHFVFNNAIFCSRVELDERQKRLKEICLSLKYQQLSILAILVKVRLKRMLNFNLFFFK